MNATTQAVKANGKRRRKAPPRLLKAPPAWKMRVALVEDCDVNKVPIVRDGKIEWVVMAGRYGD